MVRATTKTRILQLEAFREEVKRELCTVEGSLLMAKTICPSGFKQFIGVLYMMAMEPDKKYWYAYKEAMKDPNPDACEYLFVYELMKRNQSVLTGETK